MSLTVRVLLLGLHHLSHAGVVEAGHHPRLPVLPSDLGQRL